MKISRHMSKRKIDDALLRRLWPSRIPERVLAEQMGHSRTTLRRRAAKLGLPTSRRELWADQQ